ncbi:DUF2989 domain-containing protein [Colwellia sp. UCD-KL20]|uniref:DUF2989 domain-containing protein n=1 Tax=Colwellia sp. UCD-KL20 TaxID=1917165 RepID=UPI000970D565|nr:DUF2989 domain-containing protein [Colwellia sp. UCD-KL20]
MNRKNNLTLVLLTGACVLMSGCNKAPSFADLCDNHPKICNEFKEDSWCKKERIDVGFANLAQQTSPADENKYNQLIGYENYAKCMEHASKIEHIKFKEKQSMRINNVVDAKKRIKEISDTTKDSKHPSLLYYHWTRHLNKNALQSFLALEDTHQLETPKLQFNLATYYAKRDQNKTLDLLYHALELTTVDESINTEIFKSIATIFADKNKYKQVYIWSKILQTHSPEDESIKRVDLKNYAKTFNLKSDFLDDVASKTLSTILDGKFKKP